MINVTVNGETRDLPDRSTMADLIDVVAEQRRGIAVARNGEVVPRSMWDEETVEHGDRIEILRAAQGG